MNQIFSLNIMEVRRTNWPWHLKVNAASDFDLVGQFIIYTPGHGGRPLVNWSHTCTESRPAIGPLIPLHLYSACHCACAVSYWFHWFRMQRERRFFSYRLYFVHCTLLPRKVAYSYDPFRFSLWKIHMLQQIFINVKKSKKVTITR